METTKENTILEAYNSGEKIRRKLWNNGLFVMIGSDGNDMNGNQKDDSIVRFDAMTKIYIMNMIRSTPECFELLQAGV